MEHCQIIKTWLQEVGPGDEIWSQAVILKKEHLFV